MRVVFLLLAIASAHEVDLLSYQHGFADKLVAEIYDDQDSNQCSSALGVSFAMSLLYPSMVGNAERQVHDLFGFDDVNRDVLEWEDEQQAIAERYNGECESGQATCSDGLKLPVITIANAVFMDTNSSPNATYTAIIQDFYKPLDFFDLDAGAEVNAWVRDATNDLIDGIVEDGPLDPLETIAVNAIYLKAQFARPFASFRTSVDVFYKSDRVTKTTDAHFIHKVEYYDYSHTALDGFQIVNVPFVGEDLSILFAIPSNRNGATVKSVDVVKSLPGLERQRLALAVPKFEFESEYNTDNLLQALFDLGIESVGKGGLCLFEDCTSFIDFAIQKTFISLDESGVEAAAVTAFGAARFLPPDSPIVMVLDMPFQFFIYDKVSGLMLFEGRVVDPQPQASAETPTFTKKHKDEDFWTGNFDGLREVIDIFDNSDPAAPVATPTSTLPTMEPPSPSTATNGYTPTRKDTPTTVSPSASSPSVEAPTEAVVRSNGQDSDDTSASSTFSSALLLWAVSTAFILTLG